MSYATVEAVQNGFRTLSSDELTACADLLEEAALIIDATKESAAEEIKARVSIRMVRRALGDGEGAGFPIGASQGSISAMGYSQSWTMGSAGSVGEMYLNRMDRRLLGMGNTIGSYSPLQGVNNND